MCGLSEEEILRGTIKRTGPVHEAVMGVGVYCGTPKPVGVRDSSENSRRASLPVWVDLS